MDHSTQLVSKLWNYCNILRDDGLSYGDYVEQLTYLLFLKMADEQTRPPFNKPNTIPTGYDWQSLLKRDGDELEIHYRHLLETLGKEKGLLGVIFRKAQNKIQDPAKLRRLIADLIDREQWMTLEADVRGVELVDAVARLCVMNLYLHGIGGDASPISVKDSLAGHPGQYFEMVLTNPPFGKKSSVTVVNEQGEQEKESLVVVRDDFWASTSNKQLNFLQHVYTILKMHGRAAIVVPDNVLFEGGAGETIRRKLLHECDVHTLLRLPTGIFYSQGVKANVLFFDRKPASETPWTKVLWVYDLRTNKHFTLKQNTLKRDDLDDFVACYMPGERHNRKATWSEENSEGQWRADGYDGLFAPGKASPGLFLLPDHSPQGSPSPPGPNVLAGEIAEDLRSALEQIESILVDLQERVRS